MKPRSLILSFLACSVPLWLGSCGDADEDYEDDEPKKKKKERPEPEDPVFESAEQLLITEIVPHSEHGFKDADDDASDWIELYNNSAEDIALNDYALTDDEKEPAKWQFPERTLEAGAFLTVFASGKDRKEEGSHLHANFKLDADGEYLALVRVEDKKAVHAFAPVYPKVPKGQSYGYEFDDRKVTPGTHRMFKTPTPGEPNADEPPAGPAPEDEDPAGSGAEPTG